MSGPLLTASAALLAGTCLAAVALSMRAGRRAGPRLRTLRRFLEGGAVATAFVALLLPSQHLAAKLLLGLAAVVLTVHAVWLRAAGPGPGPPPRP